MNAKETKMLSIIDKQIAELQKAKEELMSSIPLLDKIKENQWLIQIRSNIYYQVKKIGHTYVYFDRFGSEFIWEHDEVNRGFRLATGNEVKQHIEYLKSKGKSYIKQNFTQRVEQREASERKVVNLDFVSLYAETPPVNSDIYIDLYRKLLEKRHNSEYDRMVKDMMDRLSEPCDLSEPMAHTIDPKKCDFYMITVTGEFGAKVRHENYYNAIKEATRLAKKQNHKAWVTGVVAVIEPIQQEVQVKVIEK